MLTFTRATTDEDRRKRKVRYEAMSEESLRHAVDRFTRELQEKEMHDMERHLKTNTLRYSMMELNRRGLFVEPVILSTQKKKKADFFITMEIDPKSIETNMMKVLKSR